MKNYLNFCLPLIALALSITADAQEICGNGIDDDGNGLIDCFDSQCSTDPSCDGSFFGSSVTCADEVDVDNFAIRLQWTSEEQTATSHATPAVGDLDGNGIPEIITVNNGTKTATIINGSTGATLRQISTGFTPENTPVIANIDGDDNAEILITENKGDDMILYDNELNVIWSAKSSQTFMGIAGIADFDEDGDAEIYYRNEIKDATTGNTIVAGDGDWKYDYTHGPLAIDVLPDSECADCGGLELVTGNEIWAINESAGTRTLVQDMDDEIHAQINPSLNYYPKYITSWNDQFSSVSAADYNLDGHLDLIITGALGNSTDRYDGETTIFLWDVFNSTVTTFHDPTNDFIRGPGRVNIGDVDGDGNMNANFVMNQVLYSLDENFNIHWKKSIKEGSSGFTGCTLFDFDGDGTIETVYRSEQSVIIVDGTDGSTRQEFPCISRTQEEYPIVADVDGDGASEICVACYFSDATPFNPYENTQYGSIRIYESDGEAWMPSRKVWNQHGYYNVNINDDLTVPREVQDHAVIFSDGVCTYADGSLIPFPSRPLNTFLTQSPILDSAGCVQFVSPNIFFNGIIEVDSARCPDADIEVRFEISNDGDIAVSGALPVSYYKGDPTDADSELLDTEYTILENFEVGSSLIVTQEIQGVGGEYDLYVLINDLGGTPPITYPLNTSTIPECNSFDNLDTARVSFVPFELTIDTVRNNIKCLDSLNGAFIPNNGFATVVYDGPVPGSNENIWFENFEDRAFDASSDTDETAWSSSPGTIGPVFYGVDTLNSSKMFVANHTGNDNEEGNVTWTSETIDISSFTDIKFALDIFERGGMEGTSSSSRDFVQVLYSLDGGADVSILKQYDDFDYFRASESALNGDSLVIKVVFHNTSNGEYHYIDNVLVEGTSPEVNKLHTEADGFFFRWYEADDTDFSDMIHEGSTITGLDSGNYVVIGEFPTSFCVSDTVDVRIERESPEINVWIYEINPLDDCDVPNGSLGAFVYTTTQNGSFPASESNPAQDTITTGYTFNWVLTSEGTTIVSTGPVADNLEALRYTVNAIDNNSGCSESVDLTVTSDIVFPPAPNITVTNITTCGGTGSLSADVGGNTTDYTFLWYDGTSVKPTPDFTGVTYTVNETGDYTVRAVDNTSSCPSDIVTGTMIDASSAPAATLVIQQENAFCAGGNGQLLADGDGGDGSSGFIGFTFEWFKGNNTLPENALPNPAVEPNSFLVSDNPYQLGGLTAGAYTVIVTENASSCSDTLTATITDNQSSDFLVSDPEGSLIINDINSCNPSIFGSIDASGIVDGDVTNFSIGNVNTSFEELDILTASNFEQSFAGGTIKTFDQEDINGWSTTASDQRIEIWHNNNTIDGGIHNAFHGDQFAEINANVTAALYFDLATTPGAILEWSFAHKARGNGQDVISVNIGSAGSEVLQNTFSTGRDAWAVYSGSYEIPDDQFNTRFQFEAVSTASGNNSVGNFVDTVTFILFPFRFELFEGTNASGDPDYVNTDGVFNDLNDGDYVLVVYDNLTGCNAAEIPINIPRFETQPTITTSLTHDEYCTGGSGEISVTSSMGGAEPSSYTYQLFDGHNFSSQIGNDTTITDGSVAFAFDSLDAGNYRINVTNDDSECSDFIDIVINDATVKPQFTASRVVNDNISCAGSFNTGRIQVTIQGAPDENDNYAFTWFDGDNSSTTILEDSVLGTNNGWILDSLSAGEYTVQAENIETGCITDKLTLEVFDDPYIPAISVVQVAQQTTCTLFNGILEVDLTNDDPDESPGVFNTDNFTYQWYLNGTPLAEGIDPGNGSIPSGVNTFQVSGLAADEYTVEVSHIRLDAAGNCPVSQSGTVSANLVFPILSLSSSSPNTSCNTSNYDGTATVNVTGGTGHSFEWFASGSSTPLTDGGTISGSTTASISGLGEGTFKVVAISDVGCASDTLQVVINSDPEKPQFSPAALGAGTQNNTVCDETLAGAYDGQITVNSDAGAADNVNYTFQWYNGVGTASPISGETSNLLDSIQGGTYTVRIQSNDNSCDTTFQVAISNDLNDAFIDYNINPDVSFTDNTDCSGSADNGSISLSTASLDAAPISASGDYTFRLHFGTSADNTPDLTDGTAPFVFENLSAGDYTVEVIDNTTGCNTLPSTITISDDPLLPTASFDPTNSNDNTVCDVSLTDDNTYNGSISVVPGSGVPSDYTYKWYVGTDTTNSILPSNISNSDTSSTGTNFLLSNIPGGTYSFLLTSKANSCQELFQFSIGDVGETVVIETSAISDIDTVDISVCLDNASYPNGSIRLNNLTPSSSQSIDINWYYGSTVNATRLISDGDNMGTLRGSTEYNQSVDLSDSTFLQNIDPGNYTVQITDRETGCISPPVTITIEDVSSSPTINAADNVQDDYSCDSNSPIGIASVDPAGSLSDYTIEWYEGANTNPGNLLSGADADFSANNDTIKNVPGGLYTVKVISNATSCFTTSQVRIIDTNPTLSVNVGQTAQDDCSPNGIARVTNVTTTFSNGNPDSLNVLYNPTFPSSYTYEWFEGTSATGAVIGTDEELIGVEAGFYTVLVSLRGTGCTSNKRTIEVVDNTAANAPSFSFTPLEVPSTCDGDNGTLRANIVPNGTETYTFEWYEGSGDFTEATNPTFLLTDGDPLVNDPGGSISISSTGTNCTIDNLVTGLYTFVAIADGTGCRYQATYDLPFNGVQTTTTITIDDVDACPDNGRARVALADNIRITGTVSGSFSLLDTITIGATGRAIVNDTTDQLTGEIEASVLDDSFNANDNVSNGKGATITGTTITGIGTRTDTDDIQNYAIYLYAGSGVPPQRNVAYTVTNSTGTSLIFPYVYDAFNGVLYNGDSTNIDNTVGSISAEEEAEFNDLPSGSYTAIAREISSFNTAQCWTLAATDTVAQKAFFPEIDSSFVMDNTICDPALVGGNNGSVYVRAGLDPDDSTTIGINFYWYEGNSASGGKGTEDLLTTDNSSPYESTYGTNLSAGDYTVIVETISSITGANTCYSDTLTFTIQDDLEVHSLFSASIDTVFDCSPTNQGRIEIRDADVSSGDINDYDFEFGPLNPATEEQAFGVSNVYGSLEPGDYYVLARHITTGCLTDSLILEIPHITVDPEITASVTAIDISCDLGSDEGLGQIEFTIENTTSTSGDYNYTWYTGEVGSLVAIDNSGGTIINESGTETITAGASFTATLENIDAGIYTIEVIDQTTPDSQCSVFNTIVVNENTNVISIDIAAGDANFSDNTNCSVGANGTISINSIREDGVEYELVTNTNYTITWSGNVPGGSIQTNVIAGDRLVDLPAATYVATIVNTTTNCTSGQISFTIEDDTQNPTINLVSIDDDTFCDPSADTGDGQITVDVDGNASNNFFFRWWIGSDTAVVANEITNSAYTTTGTIATNADSTQILGLPSATYTVAAYDREDPYQGCRALSTYTIEENNPIIDIRLDNITFADNDNCFGTPNGHITVNSFYVDNVIVNMTDAAASEYTLTWTGTTNLASNGGVNPQDSAFSLPAGNYTISIQNNNGNLCPTGGASIDIEIIDDTQDPSIRLISKNDNTYCDPATDTGDGQITVDVDGNGSDNFYFRWWIGTDTTVVSNEITNSAYTTTGTITTNTDSTQIMGLPTGTYTVAAYDKEDPYQGCRALANFTINAIEDLPSIDSIGVIYSTVSPDTICAGFNSGAFIINDSDISTGSLSGLRLDIRQGARTNPIIETYAVNAGPIIVDSLAADTYFISITDTIKGCISAFRKIVIPDSIRIPQITLVELSEDQDCGTSSGVGAIEIVINEQFTEANHFTVDWYEGTDTTLAAIGNSTRIENLVSGTYSVVVSNTNTRCQNMASFDLPALQVQPSIFSISTSVNITCDDLGVGLANSGAVALDSIIFQGDVIDTSQARNAYRFEVYTDEALTSPVTDGNLASEFIFEQLAAGTYFASVTRIDSECQSEPTSFIIEDDLTLPSTLITMLVADSACSIGGISNGTLVVTDADGNTFNDSIYDIRWYFGGNPPNGFLGANAQNDTISGLPAGEYSVTVTLNETGCQSTDVFTIPNVQAEVDILDVTSTPTTTCSPGSGTIEVISVNRGDIASDYDFDFYDSNPLSGSPLPVFTFSAGGPAPIYTEASPGFYWVIGTNVNLGCETPPYQVEVRENLPEITITLDNSTSQNNGNCNPGLPNGEISIRVNGSVPSIQDYAIQWFLNGDTLTDELIGGNGTLAGATSPLLSGIPSGTYTAIVQDLATGCSEDFEATIIDEQRIDSYTLNLTTTPNENCIAPYNGSLNARVVPPLGEQISQSDFNFYLFPGTIDTDTLMLSNETARANNISGIQDGNYTLVVNEVADSTCILVRNININGTFTTPVFTKEKISDETVCFDAKDGFAQINVADFSNLNAIWTNSNNDTISTSLFADSLAADVYTITVQNVNTRCSFTDTLHILPKFVIPTDPTIIVNANRTNCQNNDPNWRPNGSATANVDGLTSDFVFNWYDQNNNFVTSGEAINNLDSGTYLVQAINMITGCESALSAVTIDYEETVPSYDVRVTSSTCLRTTDGAINQFENYAEVVFDEFNFATNYRWERIDEEGNVLEVVSEDAAATNLIPGAYQVSFTADNDCEYSDVFSVTTSIQVYNGLSANGDNRNDFFLIDCIDFFPQNTVQIFSRDGVKVYEVDNYDNVNVRFEGFSNVGATGKRLPTGTYFYVIELVSEPEPIQGYLELVR